MWLRNPRIQRLIGGGRFELMSVGMIARLEILGMKAHKDADLIRLIRQVRRQRKSLLSGNEACLVHTLARSQKNRPGHMAEVGAYQGASTKLICEAKGTVPLHVFDTFEGLPKSAAEDRNVHREHQYTCSLESVREYLKDYEGVTFYQGRFPETAGPVSDLQFSFVHLDVDLYESTLGCLEFFYPRMVAGGIILSHDYSLLAGVRLAFDRFLPGKPEGLVELPTTQCMLVKL